MSKNILLLTSIFPAEDLPETYTKVVFYFAKEWKRQGYNVKVIHSLAVYPRFLYFIARLINGLLASLMSTTIPMHRLGEVSEYSYQGVDVIRVPIFKFIPHTRFKNRYVVRHIETILDKLSEQSFVPNVIMGHWANPQLELIALLKLHYNVKTSLVLHEAIDVVTKIYRKDFFSLVKSVDYLGFRSYPLLNDCITKRNLPSKLFLCQSGIPEDILSVNNVKNFVCGKILSFVFVGMLIQRKYPEILVEVIPQIYKNERFSITYIGEGRMKKKIISIIKKKKICDKVFFTSRISRDYVHKYLLKTDCLIMVSKKEVFGLVYLEAMSVGCIVIAAKNEGADGIIVDGLNGFLCEAGNEDEFRKVLLRMNNMTPKELSIMSNNAIKTALNFSDTKMARKYLELIEFN